MLKYAFELGRKLAFQKEGTSRWREAIRSGELPQEKGQELMSRLGILPERFVSGLEQGNQKIIQRLGAKMREGGHPIIDWGLADMLINPETRTIHYAPGLNPMEKAIYGRHELDELNRVDRALPDKTKFDEFIRSPKAYIPQSNPEGVGHAGADVILKELRNLRMLPGVPKTLKEVRPETEWKEISELHSTPIEKFRIPKSRIPILAKKIQEASWLKRLTKLV